MTFRPIDCANQNKQSERSDETPAFSLPFRNRRTGWLR